MDLQPYLTASGERILKGVTGKVHGGKGEIFIAKAAVIGIDRHLVALLMAVVDELGIAMSLNSLDTGEHAPHSRHFSGRAVDCSMIGAKGGPLMPATLLNRYAVRYAEFLGAHGMRHYEQGPWGAVLLGPVHTTLNQTGASHTSHIHTSLPPAPGSAVEADGHEQSLFEEEEKEGKENRTLEVNQKVGHCLYPALQAAASLRGAFPPPFPQPRWSP